jgi:predicted nucleic acid-binding Zn ribbon protein
MSNEISLGDAIKQFIKRANLTVPLDDAKLKLDWELICGKTIAKYTDDVKVTNGKLIIKTKSSTMRDNLLYARQDVIEKVNSHFGKQYVTEVEVW